MNLEVVGWRQERKIYTEEDPERPGMFKSLRPGRVRSFLTFKLPDGSTFETGVREKFYLDIVDKIVAERLESRPTPV